MNLPELEKKLLKAARSQPPADSVPYAFEQRVMARLRAEPRMDPLAFWGRMLWRAAVPCLAMVVVMFVLSHLGGQPSDNLADDFEQTLFAGISQAIESW